MMKISTKGRYALRMLLDIARQGEGAVVSLKEISARQDISVKYQEQIVAKLRKAGYLQSVRGVQGGRGAAHRSAGSAQRPGFTRGGARAAAPAVPMTAEESFEAKLKAFMTESEGKISDLNHSMDKRGRRR